MTAKNYSFMSFMNDNANLSLKPRQDMCQLAASFRDRSDIIAISAINTCMGILTILLMWGLCNCKEILRIWSIIGQNLKVIIFTGFLFYGIASINATLVFGYNTLLLFTNMPSCLYIWKGSDCFYFQLPYWAIYVQGYFSFHVALFVERAFVTFVSTKSKYKVGWVVTFVMLLSVGNFLWSSQYVAFKNDRVFCFSSTTTIDSKINGSILGVIAQDFAITILEFFLLLWNQNKYKRYKKQIACFSLEDKFKLREVRLSISAIYPYSLVHSLGYCLQMYSYVWYTEKVQSLSIQEGVFFYCCVNFIRLACAFTSLAFLLCYAKVKARQSNVLWAKDANGMDQHFKEFQRIIS